MNEKMYNPKQKNEKVKEDRYKTLKNQLENIGQSIVAVKGSSMAHRNARQQKINQFKHELNKKQMQFEEELKRVVESPLPDFKIQSLGGLVIQVPENQEFHKPEENPYSPRNSTYYVSEVIKNYRDPKSSVKEHLDTSLQILKALEKSKLPTKSQIQNKMLELQIKPECTGLKTVVFDLDETLIHCNENPQAIFDIKITIKFPTGQTTQAGINIRPGAIELLHLLKGKFEVMIFTASHSCYANEILDYLDPKKELIHHRLYRQHCHISNEGYYIKDLRILGRPMKDLLLVDNAAYSYAYQLDNGVPILPYFQGKNDFELKALGEYLMKLYEESELRAPNHLLFKLNRYIEFVGRVQSLVEQLYLS